MSVADQMGWDKAQLEFPAEKFAHLSDKAQAKLNALRAEYNDGNPVRTALELRNPQGYPERVEKLKADIARQESDVAGIRRELDRLPAN